MLSADPKFRQMKKDIFITFKKISSLSKQERCLPLICSYTVPFGSFEGVESNVMALDVFLKTAVRVVEINDIQILVRNFRKHDAPFRKEISLESDQHRDRVQFF